MTLILLAFFSLGSFTCSQLFKITCSRVRENDRDLCCKTLVLEFFILAAVFPGQILTFLQRFACFAGQIVGFIIAFIIYSQCVLFTACHGSYSASLTLTLLQILERVFGHLLWRCLQNWPAWLLPHLMPPIFVGGYCCLLQNRM
jgi:hypothetical protein